MAKKKVSKKSTSKKAASKKSTAKKASRKKAAARSTGRNVRVTKSESPATAPKKSSDRQMRAIIGLIVNILVLPGLGTIIGGDTKPGVWQLVLFIAGIPLSLILVGIPMVLAAWIWALVSSVKQLQRAS